MDDIPRDDSFDGTLGFFREGYNFIRNRCDRLSTDIFETRLMLYKTVCMRGAAAARDFYDPDKFIRSGAMPRRVLKTLVGDTSIHTTDGEIHRKRKSLYLTQLSDENVARLRSIVRGRLEEYSSLWSKEGQVVLYDEVTELLCRSVFEWAGLPLEESDVWEVRSDIEALIDSPAAVGPRYWRGRFARRRLEKWLSGMIERTRKIDPDGHAVLNAVAAFKESDGRLLSSKEASVELLNFLRPTVAVARFVVFAALAIEQNHDAYERLRSGDQEYLGWFIDEVRRLHPLIPIMAAYTKRDAEVLGHSVPDSTLVALDLFGTCRHPAIWGADADDFRPERFEEVPVNPFNFIPQGGGDVAAGHRCPGEGVAREILRASIQHLVEDITYRVPPQDLSVDLARIPMIPASRFVISDVRPAQNFL